MVRQGHMRDKYEVHITQNYSGSENISLFCVCVCVCDNEKGKEDVLLSINAGF